MTVRFYRRVSILFLLIVFPSVYLGARDEWKDSLVRLISARSAELKQIDGRNFRKVMGPARFLHNGTYLICDSALWNVDEKYIDCMGHVQLAQEGTLLTSDDLHYIIDSNLAQFRGNVVELNDKNENCMKTRFLDYDTKDSIGLFYDGASMRDKDGNLIESSQGRYDGKASVFTFEHNVEFFSDSLFLKTSKLVYDNNSDKAFFSKGTYLWRDSYFLSADDGWYDRKTGDVFFDRNVYAKDPDYELWADSLYCSRDSSSIYIEMNRNVEVLDTASSTAFFANKFTYENDTLKSNYSRLSDKAAIIYFGNNESGVPDSLFFCADSMLLYTKKKYELSSEEVKKWDDLRDLMFQDPIGDMRKEKAEAYAKKMQQEYNENRKYMDRGQGAPAGKALSITAADSTAAKPATSDSMAVTEIDTSAVDGGDSGAIFTVEEMSALLNRRDTSLSVGNVQAEDSGAVAEMDSTIIGFLMAKDNVKAYRTDMQLVCDSLFACSLDSIGTVYKNPVLWDDTVNQLTADSMRLMIRNRQLAKGNMVSDAFIITQEDSIHFNQIKSTEMIGHFMDNHLVRYDALGGASAVFFLAEHGELTTVNLKEAKMLSADIKGNKAQRMYYFDTVKSDAYPLVVSDSTDERLKDFEWRGDERPVDRFAVTSFNVSASERRKWSHLRQPDFPVSEIYFPGYIHGIREEIATRKDLKRRAELRAKAHEDSMRVYAGLDAEGRLIVDDPVVGAHLDTSGICIIDSTLVGISDDMLVDVMLERPLFEKMDEDIIAGQSLASGVENDICDSLVRDSQRFAAAFAKIADSLEVVRMHRQAVMDSLVRLHRDSLAKTVASRNDRHSETVRGNCKLTFFQKIGNFFRRLFHVKPLGCDNQSGMPQNVMATDSTTVPVPDPSESRK